MKRRAPSPTLAHVPTSRGSGLHDGGRPRSSACVFADVERWSFSERWCSAVGGSAGRWVFKCRKGPDDRRATSERQRGRRMGAMDRTRIGSTAGSRLGTGHGQFQLKPSRESSKVVELLRSGVLTCLSICRAKRGARRRPENGHCVCFWHFGTRIGRDW